MFGANPFGPMPSSAPANPFASNNNPFGASANPFAAPATEAQAKPSPFGDILKDSKPSEPSKEEFDIDDLVKKLDAKIAELEKEEAEQEKAKGNIPKASEVKSEPGKIDFDSFDEDIMDDFLEDLTNEIFKDTYVFDFIDRNKIKKLITAWKIVDIFQVLCYYIQAI